MSKYTLTAAIRKRNAEGLSAFIPYMMAGDGGLEVLHERISFLEEAGADAIEIGIPFSDPVADGEVIQEAGSRALQRGVTLRKVMSTLQVQSHKIPLVIMTYLNPVLAYGLPKFVADCECAGVNGLIIPDLPHEERGLLSDALEAKDIALVPLISLTSSTERIEKIARAAEGFIYAVTVNGITGVRSGFSSDLMNHLTDLKRIANVPVLAGFGISTPEQVREFSSVTDGVIVGSAIVTAFHEGKLDKIQSLIKAGQTAVKH
ncbi:tryptophan synthase subunit alpha [Sporosarcina sp. BI001-red]|uniref:tryptophan synthase subunit alpha n=1 Tax=Sporosarcina sp. BI001-red TaxID=2282866 RepID=UPI000E287E70|nr:tryptophan synthase subunit alpha [Sporosarcina sp. BI001-red]REB07988.1 tryptophan synthase subunit alpha [Sporosarcina sp. BI001-red]